MEVLTDRPVADVAMKFETSGKQVALRHLSPDCRKLLGKAGSLVTLTVLEDDLDYGVAMDYPADVVDLIERLIEPAVEGPHWRRSER